LFDDLFPFAKFKYQAEMSCRPPTGKQASLYFDLTEEAAFQEIRALDGMTRPI